MNGNLLLANLISLFHTIVVLFMLIAPFTGKPALMILHIVFGLSLLVHWWANNNICSLTYLEAQLRGLDHTESFTHKFIGPVYDICKTDWSTICYILTIALMMISMYNLYHSPIVKAAFECYRDTNTNTDVKLTFSERIKCFAPLFKLN